MTALTRTNPAPWTPPAVLGVPPAGPRAAAEAAADAGATGEPGRDPQAFAVLYRQHYAPVHAYLRRRTGDAALADDLAAETFLAAWRTVHRYEPRGLPVRAWLLRIATNAANRWARREQRRRAWMRLLPRLALAAPLAPSVGEEAEPGRIHQALLRLRPEHQAVLVLHHVEGLSLDEVGAVLGRPAGTIKSRLFRARAAFRAVLAAMEANP